MMQRLLSVLILGCLATVAQAQWVQTNWSLSGTVSCFAVNGTNLFAGITGGGIGRSPDDGSLWIRADTGLANPSVTVMAANGTTLFAGTYGGLFRSTDNGSRWAESDMGITDRTIHALAAKETTVFAGGKGGVFRSTDNGLSWVAVNDGLTTVDVRSLVISGTDVIAGTYGGGIFRSTDNGTSWVGTSLTTDWIQSLAVSGTAIFAGSYGNGVFRSTDNGSTWTQINTGLANTEVRSLVATSTDVFAGTQQGVFRIATYGSSWEEMSGGLTNKRIRALIIRGAALYAGLDGWGIWRSQLPTSGVEDPAANSLTHDNVPTVMAISPNPVAEAATLRYSLNERARVTIVITDVVGRTVARPVADQIQEPGSHDLAVTTADLKPGVYLCRFTTHQGSSTAKFTVIPR